MTQQEDIGARLSMEKPVPRKPRSAEQAQLIRIQNRRREYLNRNPSYLTNLDHELKDPVLYARLVKRFHSAAQRESELRAKGYSRVLEADLLRGVARLSSVDPSRVDQVDQEDEPSPVSRHAVQSPQEALLTSDEPWDAEADSQEDGQEKWRMFLEEMFVRGKDEDFDYTLVDDDDDLDEEMRREEQEAWFDEEEPAWEGGSREGETGVQDF